MLSSSESQITSKGRTRSKSRTYDPIRKKFVFTNKYRRQAKKQKSNTRKLHVLTNDINAKRQKVYLPTQYIGLPTTNNARRTKSANAAFRGSKYRDIFNKFNQNRT